MNIASAVFNFYKTQTKTETDQDLKFVFFFISMTYIFFLSAEKYALKPQNVSETPISPSTVDVKTSKNSQAAKV